MEPMKIKPLLKDMESIFLSIERRKYFNYIEADRPDKFSDEYLLFFATECLKYFIKDNDFRYFNLALKIKDSKSIAGDKKTIDKLSVNAFKKTRILLKI